MCPNYIPQDNTFNHYLRKDYSLSVFPMFTIHGALMHINHKQKNRLNILSRRSGQALDLRGVSG